MTAFWQSWPAQNALVALLAIALAFAMRAARRRAYWRSAFRRVFRRRAARVSFAILCLYVAIAALDSVGWSPVLRDADGEPLRHARTGTVIRDAQGLSLLDALLAPLRTRREHGYSAPFARYRLDPETVVLPDGRIERVRTELAHPRRHPLGTDRVGNDVLYLALKGVRTGIVIGAFTTLLVVPFALVFGMAAGWFGRATDAAITYVYTVIASIPNVLLIAAFMLIAGRGLAQLCLVMGLTAWTGLCRIVRGETLKLREMDYVQAARALGGTPAGILRRHVAPNLMPLVLIAAVLGFSGRVLAEAVLSYLGIGVGADTVSWGAMINDARLELARAPVVWWKLCAAFAFMLGLVLPANLFGDALRDALDPKLRTMHNGKGGG